MAEARKPRDAKGKTPAKGQSSQPYRAKRAANPDPKPHSAAQKSTAATSGKTKSSKVQPSKSQSTKSSTKSQSSKNTKAAASSKAAATNSARASSAAKSTKKSGASSRGRRKARPIARFFRGLGIVLLTLAIIVTVGGIIFYERTELPDPNADFTTQTTTVYYSDGQTELGRLSIQNRDVIDYEEMPQEIKDAIVAAEDRSFWTNSGIDIKGMARALWRILRGQEIQGGSTITQQYIKIRYLTSDQTLARKFRELALAIKMNQSDSKQDVLAGYLNTIYFGRGSYGVQAAAQAYFNIDAAQLNLSQAATLAALVNSPSALDPVNGPQAEAQLLERYNYVLEGMRTMGTIEQADLAANYDKLPNFAEVTATNIYGGPGGFLLQMATEELLEKGFTENQIQGGGLHITTTFDAARQRAAQEAVEKNVQRAVDNAAPLRNPDGTTMRDAAGNPIKPDINQLHVGLASIDVKTGAVVALYGGPDFVANSRNWATTPRYAASTFKVYGVLAGLRNGFSLNSVLRGSTYTPKGDSVPVQNDSGYNYGPITLLKATQDSVNTAFVDLIDQIPDGNKELIRAANDAGVPTHGSWAEQGGRLVLGEGEVSALSNTAGFATIANQGMRMPTHVVEQVKDSRGEVIYSAPKTGTQAIENAVARDTIHALHGAVAGTTINAVDGRDVAGKTGTEGIAVGQDLGGGQRVEKQITRAAWLSGFTADIATSVLMVAGDDGNGNLDPYAPPGYTAFYGASYPTTIWNDYMREAVKGSPRTAFPKPAYLQPTVRPEQPVYVPPVQPEPSETIVTQSPEPSVATQTQQPVEPPASAPQTVAPPPEPSQPAATERPQPTATGS